jgi:pimeloyl-ACP methyl ester carboxylesterase
MQQNKKNLVLFPALMCNEQFYLNQIKSLNSNYYNIYTIFNPFINNMPNLVDYTIEKIKQLIGNNKFYVIGTSMGGYVAMELMNSELKTNIEKLCFINTTAYPDTNEKVANRLHNIEMASKQNDDDFIKHSNNSLDKILYLKTEDNIKLLKDMYVKMGRQAFINQTKCILSRDNYSEKIKHYTTHTLIISADNDTITPTDIHQKMHRDIKNSHLVVLNNCGHLSPIDQSVAVSALISYWLQS